MVSAIKEFIFKNWERKTCEDSFPCKNDSWFIRIASFCKIWYEVEGKETQVEKSEAKQYLQLVQYCASCNRGVMPVLPVNTVPNIGIVQAYYWRRTVAVYFGSTGETLK